MEKISSNINKILQNPSVLGEKAPLYSTIKIKIAGKQFNDCKEAIKYFSEIPNASGWLCDTSTSGFRIFSQEQKIDFENIKWVVEGESVSSDGKISSRISQNQDGGWLVQTFAETQDADAKEYLVKDVELRQVGGGKHKYQIAYSLVNNGEKNQLLPAWQRFHGFSKDN